VPQTQNLHHRVPRAKRGRGGATLRLHQICHKDIHAKLT